MFDHIGIHARDLDQSVVFYREALGALGHTLASSGDGYAGLGPADAPALWLYAASDTHQAAHGSHIAFRATSRAAVDGFHAKGLRAGGRDNGKPGLRADYGPGYYAAFLIDPDGNNVEAVFMEA